VVPRRRLDLAPDLLAWLEGLPAGGPLFWKLASEPLITIDVGAHVGLYSVLAGLANPNGKVIALEPLPVVHERLQRNLQLNLLSNVIALPLAGAEDGLADFHYIPGLIPSSSSLSAEFMRAGEHDFASAQVRVTRLDSLLSSRGSQAVDLIKLDTETTEPAVLAGMGELLNTARPDIICEVLTRSDVGALTGILEPLGYSFYLLTDDGPQPRHTVAPDPRWLNYYFTTRRPG
jgi:FkbM family methyltransferase